MKRTVVKASNFLSKKGKVVFRTRHSRIIGNRTEKNKDLLFNTLADWLKVSDTVKASIDGKLVKVFNKPDFNINNSEIKREVTKLEQRIQKANINAGLILNYIEKVDDPNFSVHGITDKSRKIGYVVFIDKRTNSLSSLISNPKNLETSAPLTLRDDVKKIKKIEGLETLNYIPASDRLKKLYLRMGGKDSGDGYNYTFKQYE